MIDKNKDALPLIHHKDLKQLSKKLTYVLHHQKQLKIIYHQLWQKIKL